MFDGTWSEWRESQRRQVEAPARASAARKVPVRSQAAPTRKPGQAVPPRGEQLRKASQDQQRWRRELEKVEERIAAAEKRREDLQLEMEDPENALNWVKLGQLRELQDAQERALSGHYAEWERLSSSMEGQEK